MWPYFLLSSVLCGFVSSAQYSQHGNISSPNYPRPYPDSKEAIWEISVPKGFLVKLIFQNFDLEPSENCHYDYVEVLSQKKSLGKFCGRENAVTGNYPGKSALISKGSNMTVVFKSDYSNEDEYIGFIAHYAAIDLDECSQNDVEKVEEEEGAEKVPLCDHYCHNYVGGYFCSCRAGYNLMSDRKTCKENCSNEIYTKSSGVISSPEYPQPYPPDLSCKYSIRLEKGQGILLEFEYMDIDSHPEVVCPYDILQITANGKELGSYCGSDKPGIIETFSHTVDIYFYTDDSGDSRGWKLRYKSDRVRCPNPVPRDKYSVISPVMNEYRFLDYIIVNCTTGYKIMDNGRELQSFLTVCTSTGTWQKNLPSCKIIDCGTPTVPQNGYLDRIRSTGTNTYQSVIQYGCNKHYEMVVYNNNKGIYTCAANRRWQDVDGVTKIPDCLPICGKPVNPVEKHQRVLSGMDAPEGSFPWQSLVTINGRSGGALINDQWILTAAHIVYPKGVIRNRNISDIVQDAEIHLGENDIDEFNFTRIFEVESIFVNENFGEDLHNFDSDIALIKLKKKVTLNDNILPICLPPREDDNMYEANSMGYVSGWGVTEERKLSNKLKYLGLPIVRQETCKKSYQEKKIKGRTPVFNDNMFCAGFREGGKDTCQGDSGGAFAMQKNGTWVVTGIVSWGIECGKPGHYGAYTKVSQYLHWLNEIISNN